MFWGWVKLQVQRTVRIGFNLRARPLRPESTASIVKNFLNLLARAQQVLLYRFPNYLKIDLEVSMRERVAHLIGASQWKIRMLTSEIGKALFNDSTGFPNSLQIAYDSVLSNLTTEEVLFTSFSVFLYPVYCLSGMLQHVLRLSRIGFHIVFAS